VTQYFCCSEQYGHFGLSRPLSRKHGYFRFGDNTLYGRVNGQPAATPMGLSQNEAVEARIINGTVDLPFNVTEIVDNLRQELYAQGGKNGLMSAVTAAYYLARPILPVIVRKHLQAVRLRDWDRLPFPRWPVDRTVDDLMEQLLLLMLRAQNLGQIPFIWFWPDGASSCVLMTHDVETASGVDRCHMLMDVNDSFGIKASFQVVPEERYPVTSAFLESIRERGFEVAVHDLNHDGRLFQNRKSFAERVAKINAYGKKFEARGFRSGVLYRNQAWFNLLDFQYDMSVPNVAHLDPQRGGCCTVMPYFNGRVLELPVTMTQDYTLFHILNHYSTDLWKQQIELIMERHGLISAIVHPDYLMGRREIDLYESLLAHLSKLRIEKDAWVTTPGEVNTWWRQRAEMTIVESNGQLRIEGSGKERARIAYATEKDGRIALDLQPVCAA